MSYTCFQSEGPFSGRWLCIQLWYGIVCFTCSSINSLVDRKACPSTYKIAYIDACTTYHIITVYTTVFLKMNLRD